MTLQLSVISADGGARQLEASRQNMIRVKCLLCEEGEELKNARTRWDDAVLSELSEIFFLRGTTCCRKGSDESSYDVGQPISQPYAYSTSS